MSLILATFLAACGDDDGGSPPEFDFSAAEAEVEAFLDETDEVDGVGAIIVHRDYGVIYQRSFGAFTDDRISLIASASKMISAGVLLRLQDEELLDIDEPIIDVVGWGEHNPTLTPAQLVSNSSGLVSLTQNPAYAPYLCQYLARGTLEDCARTIFATDRDDDDIVEPDTQFNYGGGQWQLAGGVAEVVSGKSWAELIDEIYVEPCGLEVLAYNNHFTQLTSSSPFGYPDDFDGDPSVLMATDNPNIEGGAYSTIGDYGKLLLMHLRGGVCGDQRVLSEEAIRRMHTDRIFDAYGGSTDGGTGGYGLGWWLDRTEPDVTWDPGAYGAFPWIDESRGYAAYFQLEATSGLGAQLFGRTVDLINEAIDDAG